MARKPKKQTGKSALAKKLEAGENVKGCVGFIELKDEDVSVYVKVTVIGLSAEGCGLNVLVQPVSGAGKLEISPCRWIDTPADIEEKERIDQAVREAKQDLQTIRNNHYLAAKANTLAKYVEAKMTRPQQNEWWDNVEAVLGKRALSKVSLPHLMEFARAAVCVVNGVPADEITTNRYEWEN